MTSKNQAVAGRTISRILGLALAALFLGVPSLSAAQLTVCDAGCDYSSVKTAVQSASNGDQLLLSPQTFDEGKIWIDKDLTIRTSSGRATVDGSTHRYVFQVHSGAEVIFENLTLRGGTDARLDNMGTAVLLSVYVFGDGASNPSSFGGILNQSSGSLVLGAASVVAGNASTGFGGGITNNGELVIDGSTVMSNTGHRGGGFCNLGGTVSVSSSSFSFNHATFKGGGWASAATTGTVVFQPSASYSVNTAGSDCNKYWDRQSTPECVN